MSHEAQDKVGRMEERIQKRRERAGGEEGGGWVVLMEASRGNGVS